MNIANDSVDEEQEIMPTPTGNGTAPQAMETSSKYATIMGLCEPVKAHLGLVNHSFTDLLH